MRKLRNALDHHQWAHAIKAYTSQFQEQLPDWIVYIDGQGRVTQCVVANLFAGSEVRGQQFIWVMVFTDIQTGEPPVPDSVRLERESVRAADSRAKRQMVAQWDVTTPRLAQLAEAAAAASKRHPDDVKLAAFAGKAAMDAGDAGVKRSAAISALAASLASTAPDTVDLRFYRRTVVRQSDPVLIGLIKGLGKVVGIDPTVNQPTSLPDSTNTVWLHPVSVDPTETLRVGFARMAMVENAVVELALAPPPGKEFLMPKSALRPQLDRIYTNIADVKEHTFELGILGAGVVGKAPRNYDTNTLADIGTDGFNRFRPFVEVIANVPARWAWMPVPCFLSSLLGCRDNWRHFSLGAFGGTTLSTSSIGGEYAYGVTIGHLLGDAGISVGAASLKVQVPRLTALKTITKRFPILGLDLRF
jgi:hypothetical protein